MPKHSVPSLREFVLNQRRAARRASCKVCGLPDEIRTEIRLARERKYTRDEVLAYLHAMKQKVTDEDLTSHYAGLHEKKDAAK